MTWFSSKLRLRHYYIRPLSYIHNRWVDPKHTIVIRHPEFGMGQYHDLDYRMLYALFQMVVNYVEIECAALNGRFQTPSQKWCYRLSTIPFLSWFIPYPRNARRGLHHLRWVMKLKHEIGEAERGGLEQAHFAEDMFRLYKFWKHTRPHRIDPWATYIRHREQVDWNAGLTEEDRALFIAADALEALNDHEDNEMLHLIINNRNRMWT